jgi:hypothetical protein
VAAASGFVGSAGSRSLPFAGASRWAVSWVGGPVWVVGRRSSRLGVLVAVACRGRGRACSLCVCSVRVPGFGVVRVPAAQVFVPRVGPFWLWAARWLAAAGCGGVGGALRG